MIASCCRCSLGIAVAFLGGYFAAANPIVDFTDGSCKVELEDGPALYKVDSPEKQLERTSRGLLIRSNSGYEKGHAKWMILRIKAITADIDWSDKKFALVMAAPPSGRFSSHVAVNLSDRDGEMFQLSGRNHGYNEHGEFYVDFDTRDRKNGKKGWGTEKADGIMDPPLRLDAIALHFNQGVDELGTIGNGEVILLRMDEEPREPAEIPVAREVVSREAISVDTMYPGAEPFPGAKELRFRLEPAFSGNVTLTLSHGSQRDASKGKISRFQSDATNGLACFPVNLPYDIRYQFLSIDRESKDDQPYGAFRVVKAGGLFVQTIAEAVRFRVETGNPLHIVRDGKDEKPVLFFRNPACCDIKFKADAVLTDYFGREVRIPFEGVLRPREEVKVDIPWPLPSRGIWRVRAEISGADGSKTTKEDRFAWIDLHEVTAKTEKPKFRMGIHYHGTRYFPDKIDVTIAALVASGAKFVRCDYDHMWADIERQQGVYSWEKSDFMINKLSAAGLALDIIFACPPSWAYDESSAERAKRMKADGYRVKSCNYLPRAGLFQEFCEKYARRYGTKIDYYECGNEWDLTGTGTTDFEDFLRVQKEAYDGLHAGCRDVCVIPNGWTTAVSCSNGNLKVWQNGLVEYFAEHPEVFDAWALHCHGTPESFRVNISERFLPMRESKPLKSRPWLLNETALSCVNGMEDEVASAVWQKIVYGWAMGARDYIWYNLRATGWFDGGEPGYGLITPDFRPRAGYASFAALTTILQGMDFDSTLYSKGLRHLFQFHGSSQAMKGGIALIGWDTLRENSLCCVELDTDASRALAVDMMGNSADIDIRSGKVAFKFGFRPKALLLEGATRVNVIDRHDLEREDVVALVIRGKSKRPDVVMNTASNVKDLYEANPAMTHRLWKGPEDHSARIWFVPDKDGFVLKAIVRDDVHADGDAIELTVANADGEVSRYELKPQSRQGSSDSYEHHIRTDSKEVGVELVVHDDDGEGEDSYLSLTKEGAKPLVIRFE